MAKDLETAAHKEWLGYVQPVGLVVSIPALLAAQAHVNRNIASNHQRFLACLPRDKDDEPISEIRDFAEFTRSVLGWRERDLEPIRSGDPQYAAIEVTLPEYHETLRTTHVVREFEPKDPNHPWMMLVRVLPVGTELDTVSAIDDRHWQATPHAKFERLLRETQIPIGLLANDRFIRLMYAPRGETSGYATFSVAEMVQVAGRPIFAALHMLLGEERLFSLGEKQRLPAILADSRKYQNVVSTKLAEQVLAALFELVRGFQAADDQAKGQLLRDVLAADPNHVYHGLLTVLMRLVFILYAEDRGLLSSDPVYVNYYAVTGLFERLRADAGRFPDTMDLRYGAWAHLLTLFRLIYEGGSHGGLEIPARHGYLFDPDRYPFLEGRDGGVGSSELGGGAGFADSPPPNSQIPIPRVSDGVIFRVLNNLLILDGERLSYRTLDVEQIGSVYEAIMGFNLEVARGPSIAIKPKKAHGAPASINLEALLATKPADRLKWLREQTDQELTGQALDALKKAATIEDLLAALERRIAREVTPNVVSKGAMVLQPSDERRRSGSHYTPRSLTEPIVATTLRPILERLGIGRSDFGGGEGRGHGHGRTDQLVSRPQSVASWDGSGRGLLSGDERAPARGEVRDNKPDTEGGGGDPGEHRGGARAWEPQGVSTIPPRSTGEPSGTGNASSAQHASGFVARNNLAQSAADSGSTRQDAQYAPESSQNPTSGRSGTWVLGRGESGLGAAAFPTPQLPTSGRSGTWVLGRGESGLGAAAFPTPQLLTPSSYPTPEQILDLKVCDPAMGSGAFLVEACRQLGDALVKAWHVHDCVPKLPPDEDDVLHARRLIAQRCLYGVDKNPMAVDLSKLSLWLATLAKDHPFTFLDHSLRCGDSLVGLTREQITAFHWQPKKQMEFLEGQIGKGIARATEYRRQILAARDDVPYEHLRQCLDVAEEALSAIRLTGDAAIAAYFSADKDRQRERNREELAGHLESYLGRMKVEDREPIAKAAAQLRSGERGIVPFHWQIEFPEVFTVDAKGNLTGGFDAIVGNPPFMGGSKISTNLGPQYLDWLMMIHEQSHGNGDLVAHFFRRAFNILKTGGCFGLIATNTIGQGDTRSTGLRWICTHSGTIYNARKRYKWPGQAAVVVSVIHVARDKMTGPFLLDGRQVSLITAYLFHAGGHDDPEKLKANAGRSFLGSKIYGQGLTFDDSDSKGIASPIAEMRCLIAKDPRNAERIFPYIGGEEVNDSPTHAHHRFVINFGEMTEEEARRWPDLMRIVEEKVKPSRLEQNREIRARYWWRFGETTPALFEAIRSMDRVLVCSLHQPYWLLSFLPANFVFSHALAVFALQSSSSLCTLQSRPHEVWARFFSSSMKDDMRYTPSDCFETFPFPENFESNPALEAAGKVYYEFRAALMVQNNEGLTKTYNRFHDPYETSPEIKKLRVLHDTMDRAVLDSYGWSDLRPTCEFLLDYEEDENEEETGSTARTRKKPWRYRWPDDFRDEVLARLLDLNQKRAELERLAGRGSEAKSRKPRKTAKKAKERGQPGLF